MSGPISPTITSAARSPTPGIARSRPAAASNGFIASSIRSSSRAIRPSSASIWSISTRSRKR